MGARAARWSGEPGGSATDGYRHARRAAARRRLETVGWLLVAAGAAVLTGWSALPGRDRPWSAAAAAAALVAARVCRPAPDPERWLRGAAGEVATAHLLERLGDRRWAVLHDVRLPGSTANVDHLVIGRRGVWVLDSKAYRAPVRAGWRGVRVGGRRLDTSPVAWEASVVADRLRVEVRPLVVVHGVAEHGGRLPRRGRRCDGVRVLPAEAVVRHLRRARTGRRLGRADVADLVERAATLRPAP